MSTSISPPPSKRRKLRGPDPEETPAPSADLTIYSWNVNGIAPLLQRPITSFFGRGDGRPEINAHLRGVLRRYGWPTMFFLQEVKIAPGDSTTIRAVQKSIRAGDQHDEPDYLATFCLPCDEYNARGFGRKIYGVCSIVRKDFYENRIERIRPVTWDEEGRFLVVETKATETSPKLAIFNVYAVNGTDHPYRDSHTGEITGRRHDRKLEVHRLLAEEIKSLEADGFAVVVAGDINVARSELDGHPNLRTIPHQHCLNRLDFERRFMMAKVDVTTLDTMRKAQKPAGDDLGGLGMIDTFRLLHPDRLAFTYHPRGKPFGESCDRVDMILASSLLSDNLVEAEIFDTTADRGPSDHVPLMSRFRFDTKQKKDPPEGPLSIV